MSGVGKKEPPPYLIPVQEPGKGDVAVYHTHMPFNPMSVDTASNAAPVYSGGGGGGGGGGGVGGGGGGQVADEGKKRFVSYDGALGTTPGMTTCTSCQQQVMTEVTYKAGRYAWLMCLLFICCGLVCCCCLIPFFVNRFKNAYHTCPRCNRVLHVEKRRCCK